MKKVLFVLMLLLVSCGEGGISSLFATPTPVTTPTPTCPEMALSVGYFDEVDTIVDEWFDAEQIASSTSRIALAQPLSEMQAIARRAERIEQPPCMEPITRTLTRSMDKAIDAFLAFMAQEDDDVVAEQFDASVRDFERFMEDYSYMQLLALEADAEAEETPTPEV